MTPDQARPPVMTDDDARKILGIIILDRQDVRDRYLNERYADLLARAAALVGACSDGISETRSKAILARAHQAARRRLIYSSPVAPAQAAASVLLAALGGASK